MAIVDPSTHNQLLWVAIVYIAANIVDTMVVFPLVVAKIVNLHPVAVVIAVIIGAQFFGIPGMLLAVPAMSIFKILVQEFYVRIYGHAQHLDH